MITLLLILFFGNLFIVLITKSSSSVKSLESFKNEYNNPEMVEYRNILKKCEK